MTLSPKRSCPEDEERGVLLCKRQLSRTRPLSDGRGNVLDNVDRQKPGRSGSFECTSDGGILPMRETWGPLLLMATTPQFVMFLWWVTTVKGGSLRAGLTSFWELYVDWPLPFSRPAVVILSLFLFAALGLTRLLPGETVKGPPSFTGYRNTYHGGGMLYWLCMNALFVLGASLGYYNIGILYDYYGELLSSLNVIALVFCLFLFVKARLSPTGRDNSFSGCFVADFFHGSELYPNVCGWDVKQLTNDRVGLMWWGLSCVSFAGKQMEQYGFISDTMLVSALLQWVYLTKFFAWETGYFYSMDIQHDRAGFYLCWGCLVWVPGVYALPALWLVMRPTNVGFPPILLVFLFGCLMIWLNYDADAQRQHFRSTGGTQKVWGRPPRFINAEYIDQAGATKQCLLLASGWWSISRHFHYLPEILAALMWAPPVRIDSVIPYIYTIYLSVLLLDRCYRHDERCWRKYGKHWEEYRSLVPYMLIPYVL